jgi:hypothetical protein
MSKTDAKTDASNDEDLDLSELSFQEDVLDATDQSVDWLKILAYGPPGGGKTTLMSTLPDPLLVLVTEKHAGLTIKRVNPKARLIYIEDKVDERGRVMERASDKLYRIISDLSSKKHPFVSLALDSLTDMQQILLTESKGGKVGADVSLKEWGKLIEKTKDLVIRLRNLDMHVGTICLSDEAQDNQQRLINRPALAGKKLPGAIIQYFNLCCFQKKERDRDATGRASYMSIFDGGDEYYTKTHPALDPIETPNLRLAIEKIKVYAKDHGEGDMPTVATRQPALTPAQQLSAAARTLMNEPEVKALFDELGATDAKRQATCEKHRTKEAVLAALRARVGDGQKTAAPKAAAVQNDNPPPEPPPAA